jgi:F0F1-type ATP synthase membrane subunit c/vacuolar-type H+-ATPase subunit K
LPKNLKPKSVLITLFLVAISYQLSFTNFVQADFPVATNLEVADQELTGGDIVVESPGGISKADRSYHQGLIGVVIDTPTIVLHPDTETTRAIISGGDNTVKVSSRNGNIARGDFITSSEVPGVGQKATRNGYVIGVALQNFPGEGQEGEEGVINVSLNIHYNIIEGSTVGLGALERFGQNFLNQLDNPGEFVRLSRYLLAALVAIITILLSFFTFARSVRSGIEAMGRNPLAKRSIQTGMAINAFLTSVMALFGLVAAYLIIRFF